jgi:hypothetical protein
METTMNFVEPKEVTRKFDERAYQQSDSLKYLVANHLRKYYSKVEKPLSETDVDLIVDDDILVEVQYKSYYKGKETFDFDCLRIEERKTKSVNRRELVLFYYVNFWKTHAIVTNNRLIAKSERIYTKLRSGKSEWFYHVPLKYTKIVNLLDADMENLILNNGLERV